MDPSSLSCDPVNLTSFQIDAITSALVPSFIPTKLERGSRTLNLCGKWSMCRTIRHSTFLSPLRRISNPSKWFVRFCGCHWSSVSSQVLERRHTSTILPSGYVGASLSPKSTTADLMNEVNFRLTLSSLAFPDYHQYPPITQFVHGMLTSIKRPSTLNTHPGIPFP